MSLASFSKRVIAEERLATAISAAARRNASSDAKQPNLALFKEINRLSRAGLWNSVENRPKRFLFGAEAKEAYAVYNKLLDPNAPLRDKYPSVGREVDLVVRTLGFMFGIYMIVEIYNAVFPETFRYGYKYGVKQYLEEKHRHEKEGHGHHH